jgi:hypothetical protein
MARGAGQGVRGAGKLRSDIVAPAVGRFEADQQFAQDISKVVNPVKKLAPNEKLAEGIWPPIIEDKPPEKERSIEAISVAEGLRTRSKATASEIFPQFLRLAAELDGKMEGTEYRLKTTDSLTRKIEADAIEKKITFAQAAAEIGDAARFTVSFPSNKIYEGTMGVLKGLEAKGFKIDKIKNFWGRGDSYDGFNVQVLDKNGVKSELQIHSRESFDIKTRGHMLYEEFRKSQDDDYRWSVDRAMVEFAKGVPKPDNYEKLLGIGTVSRMDFRPLNPNFKPPTD